MSEDAEQGGQVPEAEERPNEWALYEQLAAPFDVTFTDVRGGVELTYITGEQVATRLNEKLGFLNWTFRVLEHGIHAEADECWALGELTVTLDGRTVTRQQFGSQKVKRSRSSGTPLDIGFDLKGAATDAMKKTASLIGIGLYLSHKEPRGAAPQGNQGSGSGPRSMPSSGSGGSSPAAASNEPDGYSCQACSDRLTETTFRDGKVWPPEQLAGFGRRKFGRVLCMRCYREANDAKKRQEQDVAF